jgi:hypothetical protein
LIVGYDPKSRMFTAPVPPTISQDVLEDILNVYVEPTPAFRYFATSEGSGTNLRPATRLLVPA